MIGIAEAKRGQKGTKMEISAQNAKAIREKAAAEKPFIIHKLGEYPHRWNSWNPNVKAMAQQEIIIEKWDTCSVTPKAGGKVEVTTLNRRMEQELERLHWKELGKCFMMRKTMGIAVYEIDAETWENWLVQHTEAKTDNDESKV